MDTRTGEIMDLKEAEERIRKDPEEKKFIKEIERKLTHTELKDRVLEHNTPCGCGSDKPFGKCCKTSKYAKKRRRRKHK